jgi:hypothetical protein
MTRHLPCTPHAASRPRITPSRGCAPRHRQPLPRRAPRNQPHSRTRTQPWPDSRAAIHPDSRRDTDASSMRKHPTLTSRWRRGSLPQAALDHGDGPDQAPHRNDASASRRYSARLVCSHRHRAAQSSRSPVVDGSSVAGIPHQTSSSVTWLALTFSDGQPDSGDRLEAYLR